MLLTIDIGNSLIKFGLFDRDRLISRFQIPTVRTRSAREIHSAVKDKIAAPPSALVISSVVPELRDAFAELGKKFFLVEPVFVTNNFDFGLKILYQPPENLGIDRPVAAFAAVEKYGAPAIVCDFGTATTIDAVDASRAFLGGVITPGMRTLAESLFLRTSKLPQVELKKPASVIGNSTASCIQAGVFFGYLGLTEGILRRMIGELGARPRVVATGGHAALIAENCPLIEIVDENLMLEGLRLIYEKIQQ
jgi:type III pantothenate kinase